MRVFLTVRFFVCAPVPLFECVRACLCLLVCVRAFAWVFVWVNICVGSELFWRSPLINLGAYRCLSFISSGAERSIVPADRMSLVVNSWSGKRNSLRGSVSERTFWIFHGIPFESFINRNRQLLHRQGSPLSGIISSNFPRQLPRHGERMLSSTSWRPRRNHRHRNHRHRNHHCNHHRNYHRNLVIIIVFLFPIGSSDPSCSQRNVRRQ